MKPQLDPMIFGDGEADDVPVIDPLEKLLFSPPSATDPEVERRLLDAHSFAKADAMFKAQQARPMNDAGTLSKSDDAGVDDIGDLLQKRDGASTKREDALRSFVTACVEDFSKMDRAQMRKVIADAERDDPETVRQLREVVEFFA